MKHFLLVFFFSLFLSSVNLFAYVGAISTATTGAGRAAIEPTEAPVLNPAVLPFSKGYFFTTSYSFLNTGKLFSVGVADNLVDTIVPTALTYVQSDTKDKRNFDYQSQDLELAFANFYNPYLSIGLGFHHKIDTLFVAKHTQTNMFIGSMWTINNSMALAFVFDNFIQQDHQIPQDYLLKPKTSVGFSYNYKKFVRLKLDMESTDSNSFDRPALSTGVETYWNRWIILRMGARKDLQKNFDEYAAGVGFSGPKFALHYGYLASPQDDKRNYHAVDLAFPIW